MRHGWKFRRLGRDPRHRRALLKNLATALVRHERIVTTLAKAKELRRVGDRMIGLGRRDTPGARKEAWRWMRVRTVIHTKDFITRGGVVELTVSMARLKDASLVSKLFGCLRERYATRPGGFTRVLRIPNRKGDNAPMAIVELVDNRFPPLREPKVHASASRPPPAVSSLPHQPPTIPPDGTPV